MKKFLKDRGFAAKRPDYRKNKEQRPRRGSLQEQRPDYRKWKSTRSRKRTKTKKAHGNALFLSIGQSPALEQSSGFGIESGGLIAVWILFLPVPGITAHFVESELSFPS